MFMGMSSVSRGKITSTNSTHQNLRNKNIIQQIDRQYREAI